jgi:hypothetical protein
MRNNSTGATSLYGRKVLFTCGRGLDEILLSLESPAVDQEPSSAQVGDNFLRRARPLLKKSTFSGEVRVFEIQSSNLQISPTARTDDTKSWLCVFGICARCYYYYHILHGAKDKR